jgi:hypothetical protein
MCISKEALAIGANTYTTECLAAKGEEAPTVFGLLIDNRLAVL